MENQEKEPKRPSKEDLKNLHPSVAFIVNSREEAVDVRGVEVEARKQKARDESEEKSKPTWLKELEQAIGRKVEKYKGKNRSQKP